MRSNQLSYLAIQKYPPALPMTEEDGAKVKLSFRISKTQAAFFAIFSPDRNQPPPHRPKPQSTPGRS